MTHSHSDVLAGDIERDFWLAYDLLQNPKDHAEFTIVRNWVQEALEVHALKSVCAYDPRHCRCLCCFHALLLHESPIEIVADAIGCWCAMQGVCTNVIVEREKSILKQGAIQHLYGRLSGTLREGVSDASLLVRSYQAEASLFSLQERLEAFMALRTAYSRGKVACEL